MGSLVEGLFLVVRYKVGKFSSTIRLHATTKRLSSPNLAIHWDPSSLGPHSRRLLCSPTILEGAERCSIPSGRNPAHIDPFKLLLFHRSGRDSPWIHPPRWFRNYMPTSSRTGLRFAAAQCHSTLLSRFSGDGNSKQMHEISGY
jgi:hypothetical protein